MNNEDFQEYLKYEISKIIKINIILEEIKVMAKSHHLQSKSKKFKVKKTKGQKKIQPIGNCIRIPKDDLDRMLESLNLTFEDLRLTEIKATRKSKHYYNTRHENICKNVFYIKRIMDIFFYVNNTLGSAETEMKEIYDKIFHISDFEINFVKSKQPCDKNFDFYRPQKQNSLTVIQSEIKMVQQYLEEIPLNKRIMLVKDVNSVEELILFQKRMQLVLDINSNISAIQNEKEFENFTTFFKIVEDLKFKAFYEEKMPKWLCQKKRKIIKGKKTSKKIPKRPSCNLNQVQYFENSIQVQKETIFSETLNLIKDIIDKNVQKDEIVNNENSYPKIRRKVSKKEIINISKRFLRNIGF